MSATGRGSDREPHDFYATPAWCVHRLLERVRLPAGHWLDPCAGDGAIIRAARAVRTDISWNAIEIRAECDAPLARLVQNRRCIRSYFAPARTRMNRMDVILTNPPYSMAQEFIETALGDARFVAMLLRLNYLGSDKRAAFFKRMPPDVYVLPNRPSFAKCHTDSCEYAWLVWGPERERAYGRVSVLDTTPRAERIRERRERMAA